MKGSPLLRALIAFVLIALAGVPLWKLTRLDGAVAGPVQAAAAVAEVALQLTFSSAPKKFEVIHLGKVVWTQDAPGVQVEKMVPLQYPKEGVDVQFRVTWPAGAADAALRVKLTDPSGNEHDKTVWGRGEMEEVVTFP